jgi:hypothetical protein
MAARDDSKDFYKVKRVSFFGRKDVPIICQNENGPCPLLAIANVLLLRNAIALEGSPDRPEVSHAELMSLLAARLLDVNDKSTSRDEMVRQNQEQNLNDAMAVLPTLATGLDVNVRFRHPLDFEFTAELAVFDLLDVTLVHAWVAAGPEHAEARDAIGARSYNQLMERLIELATAEEADPTSLSSSETYAKGTKEEDASSAEDAALRAALALSLDEAAIETVSETPTSPTSRAVSAALDEVVSEVSAETAGDDKKRGDEDADENAPVSAATADEAARDASLRRERFVLDTFLESSASQLTRAGLRDARDAVKERELAVFFRNNHFATVFRLDGALYLLVTDQGYLSEPDVVWETLCEAEHPKRTKRRRGGRLRRRRVRAVRAARRRERTRKRNAEKRERRGRRAARGGAPGVRRGNLRRTRTYESRKRRRRDSGDVPARGGTPCVGERRRLGGRRPRARRGAPGGVRGGTRARRSRGARSARRGGSGDSTASAASAAAFGRVVLPARRATPAEQKILLQQRLRRDVIL